MIESNFCYLLKQTPRLSPRAASGLLSVHCLVVRMQLTTISYVLFRAFNR